jgi:hypothetical protein
MLISARSIIRSPAPTGSSVTNNTAYYSKHDDFVNFGTLAASSSTIGSKKYH